MSSEQRVGRQNKGEGGQERGDSKPDPELSRIVSAGDHLMGGNEEGVQRRVLYRFDLAGFVQQPIAGTLGE